MNDTLLNPLQYYKTEGIKTHTQNANQLFDDLVLRSGIDADANRDTTRSYEQQLDRCSDLGNRQALFALGCAGCILLVGLGIGALSLSQESMWFLPAGILLILLGCFLFFSSQLPGFRSSRGQRKEAQKSAQQLKDRAAEQLAPLDRLFTTRDAITLFQQTVPEFSFLDHFTTEHRAFLNNFGFQEYSDDSSSVCGTLAGTFNGNPFLFTTRLYCTMVNVTYTGSTTIHWEEEELQSVPKTRTVTDSDGSQRSETYYEQEYVTVQRSQTLQAEHTAPEPCYATHSNLRYGHHTAPDLSFSRKAGHCHKLSKSALQTKVRSGERKLLRKGSHALKQNQDFIPMVNETFDVLFGAQDRDNAHQFLQLFTPMAQENMVALLTDDTLGGDTFRFRKNKQLNIISCDNSILKPPPLHYHDYSLEKAREQFVSHHSSHFRAMFACFAPLLAIPAYQEAPLRRHSSAPASESNFTLYEHESIANAFPAALAAPPDCKTKTIRKTEFLSAADGVDLLRVHTHGFTTRSRTEPVPILGGDGRYHDVDVDWTEYIPVSKTITISVTAAVSAPDANAEPDTVRLHSLTAKIIQTSQEESR